MIAPSKNVKPKAKRIGFARVAIWSIVLVAGAIAIAIWFKNPDAEGKAKAEKARGGRIAEVAPSLADKDQSPIGIVVDELPKIEPVVTEPKTNQWGNPAHWGHKKLRPAHISRIDRSTLPLYEQIFENSADRSIAGLLVIEPGDSLIGDEVFDERFIKSFLRSIESPIIISSDDSEEAKALKRAVIDTKIELKARYDSGEDIGKMLTDIRRELRELGAYREELQEEVEKFHRAEELTVEEMEEYVEAANIMLEERGAKPIVMPEFYYRQLELRNQRRKILRGE